MNLDQLDIKKLVKIPGDKYRYIQVFAYVNICTCMYIIICVNAWGNVSKDAY